MNGECSDNNGRAINHVSAGHRTTGDTCVMCCVEGAVNKVTTTCGLDVFEFVISDDVPAVTP